jgi:hypothetical protein
MMSSLGPCERLSSSDEGTARCAVDESGLRVDRDHFDAESGTSLPPGGDVGEV